MLSVNLVKAYVREICEVRINLRHLAPYALEFILSSSTSSRFKEGNYVNIKRC